MHFNTDGDVIIRQRNDAYEDDPIIVLSTRYAAALARALLEAAELESITEQIKKKSSSAERQARYRQRHNNTNGVTPIASPVTRVTGNAVANPQNRNHEKEGMFS